MYKKRFYSDDVLRSSDTGGMIMINRNKFIPIKSVDICGCNESKRQECQVT